MVTSYLVGARAGTKAQKSRSDARGGGVKAWRQKGTGRARAGTIRSPIWRGGGVTFAAKPREYSHKVNRKMHRRAMASILSELIRQERLIVLDELTVSAPKTKELVEKLKVYEWNRVLCVVESDDQNLKLAVRNIPNAALSIVTRLSPVDLVAYDKVMITVNALKKIEEFCGG